MEPEEPTTEPTAPPAARITTYVGVKFQDAAAVYRFDAGALALRSGDQVVVSSDQGNRMGTVIDLPRVLAGPAEGPVRRVIRKAEIGDLEKEDRIRTRERDAVRMCLLRIRERGLQMKLIKAEHSHEGGKIVFYFSAEGRIDFRDLVRELAHVLHARIELKQIGPRDEAKLIGAVGPCGPQDPAPAARRQRSDRA